MLRILVCNFKGFNLLHGEDIIGAIAEAVATVHADVRLIRILVPENRVDWAGFDATAAAYTFIQIKNHATALAIVEGVNGADLEAWGIGACSADYDHEAPFEAPCRFNF